MPRSSDYYVKVKETENGISRTHYQCLGLGCNKRYKSATEFYRKHEFCDKRDLQAARAAQLQAAEEYRRAIEDDSSVEPMMDVDGEGSATPAGAEGTSGEPVARSRARRAQLRAVQRQDPWIGIRLLTSVVNPASVLRDNIDTVEGMVVSGRTCTEGGETTYLMQLADGETVRALNHLVLHSICTAPPNYDHSVRRSSFCKKFLSLQTVLHFALQLNLSESELLRMCGDAHNYARLSGLDVERLEQLALDREEMQFSESDANSDDDGQAGGGQWEEWEEDRPGGASAEEEAEEENWRPRVEKFNQKLYTIHVETSTRERIRMDSAYSVGTAITNLMSWKEDHEIPAKPFSNLLHIIKHLLPPGNCLPKTEEGAHQMLHVSPPGHYERHWCKSRREGKGCGAYLYPPLKNGHTQYARQEVHARDQEGIAWCPRCKTHRFEEVSELMPVVKACLQLSFHLSDMSLNRTVRGFQVRRGQQTYLRPIGIWYDLRPADIIHRVYRRQDSPLHDDFPADSSINDFLHSEFAMKLSERTRITDPQALLLELAADGVTVYKFKHHTTTVIVLR